MVSLKKAVLLIKDLFPVMVLFVLIFLNMFLPIYLGQNSFPQIAFRYDQGVL